MSDTIYPNNYLPAVCEDSSQNCLEHACLCHDNTQRLTDRSKCSIGFSVTKLQWECCLHRQVKVNIGAIRTSYQIRALPWHTVSYNWLVFQSLWCTAKDINCQSVPSEQNSQTRHLNVTVSLCLPSLLSFGRFVTIVQPSRYITHHNQSVWKLSM